MTMPTDNDDDDNDDGLEGLIWRSRRMVAWLTVRRDRCTRLPPSSLASHVRVGIALLRLTSIVLLDGRPFECLTVFFGRQNIA